MKVGIDPHFAYANMLCDVAWARSYGNTTFILPGADPVDKSDETKKPVEEQAGLPASVAVAISDARAAALSGRCGACRSFEKGKCSARGFYVEPSDPGCDEYVPVIRQG